jgi:hypothetical protein
MAPLKMQFHISANKIMTHLHTQEQTEDVALLLLTRPHTYRATLYKVSQGPCLISIEDPNVQVSALLILRIIFSTFFPVI